MHALFRFLRINWLWIFGTFVLSQCVVFWGVRPLLGLQPVSYFLEIGFSPTLLIIFSIFLFALFALYEPAAIFWQRYKRNYTLGYIPFTYADGIAVVIGFAIFSAGVFGGDILQSVTISSEMTTLSILVAFSLGIWGVFIRKGKHFAEQTSDRKHAHTDMPPFSDEPITENEQDLLHRMPFIEGLHSQIVNYPLGNSVVFGLHGSWREGKTSVVNLIRKKLASDEGIIIVDYDPWYYSSRDASLKGFFDSLDRALNARYFLPNLRKLLNKYHKTLLSTLKFSGLNIELPSSDEGIDELKKRIQNWIQILQKKVVIIIDDIDRLSSIDQLLQVLGVVKLSGSFDKTIFLLSCDFNIIREQIEGLGKGDPAFLEKIVQVPIDLPVAARGDIDRYLLFSYPEERHYSNIDRLFQDLKIDSKAVEDFDKEFVYFYQTKLRQLFPTLRHAKRFLNGIYARLPAIKTEVNLKDFFILEAIRIFYPDVFKDIWTYPWCYVPATWDESLYVSLPFIFPDREKKAEYIKKHVDKIIEQEKDPDFVLVLLQEVFIELNSAYKKIGSSFSDDDGEYRRNKRISHPEVFRKYFTLHISASELPDSHVEELISKWNLAQSADCEDIVLADIRLYKERKRLHELLNKIIIFLPKILPSLAIVIVKVVAKNLNLFDQQKAQSIFGSEYDRAVLLSLLLLNDRLSGNDIHPVTLGLIKTTPSFDFASRIYNECIKANSRFFSLQRNINVKEIEDAFKGRLEKNFIKGKRDIFADEPNAYLQILSTWANIPGERKIVNIYVFGLVRRNCSYIAKLIRPFIIDYLSRSSQIQFDELVAVFDEYLLFQEAEKYLEAGIADEHDKNAIELFIKVYKQRENVATKETTQEVNKNRFVELLNAARTEFRQSNFDSALSKYNVALEIQDWDDKHQWIEEAKYEKWKTLLELAWNSGAPQSSFFEKAKELARNEPQIKKLTNAAVSESADKVPVEFYSCLYYFLQWNFGKARDRSDARKHFKLHYELLRTNSASATSDADAYIKRSAELAMHIKN